MNSSRFDGHCGDLSHLKAMAPQLPGPLPIAEALEHRWLLANPHIDAGVLKIDGSDDNDTIFVDLNNHIYKVTVNGDDFFFAENLISSRIEITCGTGADYVWVKPTVELAASVSGGAGIDSLFGGDNDDTLDGDGDNDYIEGGDGADSIHGGAGDDQLWGNNHGDFIYGDGGLDEIHGQYGADKLHGGADSDVIYGGYENDELYGDGGSDYLYGENGDDILDGGAGEDKIWGGNDNDHFLSAADGELDYLNGEDGYDRIDAYDHTDPQDSVPSIEWGTD